jgi:hypothetical protein
MPSNISIFLPFPVVLPVPYPKVTGNVDGGGNPCLLPVPVRVRRVFDPIFAASHLLPFPLFSPNSRLPIPHTLPHTLARSFSVLSPPPVHPSLFNQTSNNSNNLSKSTISMPLGWWHSALAVPIQDHLIGIQSLKNEDAVHRALTGNEVGTFCCVYNGIWQFLKIPLLL